METRVSEKLTFLFMLLGQSDSLTFKYLSGKLVFTLLLIVTDSMDVKFAKIAMKK